MELDLPIKCSECGSELDCETRISNSNRGEPWGTLVIEVKP